MDMLNLFKTKQVKANVQKINVRIRSKQERDYTIVIEGMHVKSNKFRSATSCLWDKVLNCSYIEVNKNEFLSTDNIATIQVWHSEDKYIEATIREKQEVIFIS